MTCDISCATTKSELVSVALTQLGQPMRHKDETPGQGKGRRLLLVDDSDLGNDKAGCARSRRAAV